MRYSRDMNANPRDLAIDAILSAYAARHHELSIFVKGIHDWFATHPALSSGKPPTIHSVRFRLKDSGTLRQKLHRKWDEADPITPDNCFQRITDFGGVRVLHLHQEQFASIHAAIVEKVNVQKDWVLGEQPRAYTWDPEAQAFFAKHDLAVQLKDTFYTSVHYLVRPRADSPLCCEIQVRTLFEEIWGEVDHSLNYPEPSTNKSCREQLRVLAKLVGAGSRLVDSIFRTEADGAE